MLDAGMRAVVMEVSSQAMMQSRTEGIVFDYGIFTNLSEDHIGPGEHTCFDEYLACKRKLFRQCRVGIVNADDPCVDEIIRAHTCELITYGCCEDAKIRAVEIEQSLLNSVPGVKFRVRVRETEGEQATEGERATEGEQAVAKEGAAEKSHVFPVMFPMPGYFSVYNALCAITLSKELNLDEDETCKALLRASVKGRVERVPISEDFCVLIDYAHNAMALESLLTSLREYSPKRLVCLFGCGGNRSRERRFQMGEVSGKLADLTIVTSDNPRYEDPQSIIDDIKTGLEKTKGKYIDIIDRRQAIEYCLCQAREGDMIVIAGKGHETYQETGGRRIPMDDRKIIEEYMRKNRKGTP
jgi:UDP-N-acetylmuramoyl-L-alanyl-D-glutamate--2,6-diaminopimelate ligase